MKRRSLNQSIPSLVGACNIQLADLGVLAETVQICAYLEALLLEDRLMGIRLVARHIIGRVIAGHVDAGRLRTVELSRFDNRPVPVPTPTGTRPCSTPPPTRSRFPSR